MAQRPRAIRQRRVLDMRDVEVWTAGVEDPLLHRPQVPKARIDAATLVALKQIAKIESAERGPPKVTVGQLVEEALLSYVIAWGARRREREAPARDDTALGA